MQAGKSSSWETGQISTCSEINQLCEHRLGPWYKHLQRTCFERRVIVKFHP